MWWDCKDSKMDAELERLPISIFTPTVPETILQKQSTGPWTTRYRACYCTACYNVRHESNKSGCGMIFSVCTTHDENSNCICSLWRLRNKVNVQEQNIISVHHPAMLLLHRQNFIPGYLWFCNNSQTLNLSTSVTWTTILKSKPKISPLEKLRKIVPLVWKPLVNVP